MTPPASAAVGGTHRTGLRRGAAPRAPRRVSGPSRPPRAGAVVLPRPGRAAPALAPALGARALRHLAALPDAPLLDRLLRGRAWLAVVTFALIGIVFMQVSLLKLNTSIGRAVEHATTLERQNATLDAEASQLGSSDRLQRLAQRLGMVMPSAGAVTFLGRDGRRVGGDASVGAATTGTAYGTSTTASTTTPSSSAGTATTATTTSGASGYATTGSASGAGTAAGTSGYGTSTYGTSGSSTSTYGASSTGSHYRYGTTATTPSTTSSPPASSSYGTATHATSPSTYGSSTYAAPPSTSGQG